MPASSKVWAVPGAWNSRWPCPRSWPVCETAAVINVGAATPGALVGAGGYGQPILTGIRLDDTGLILEGAVPAALMALLAQWLFEVGEKAVVPRGLRQATSTD